MALTQDSAVILSDTRANTCYSNAVVSRYNFFSPAVPAFLRLLYMLVEHRAKMKGVNQERNKFVSLAKAAAVCELDETQHNDDEVYNDTPLLRVLYELQVCGFAVLSR
uniref:Thiazole synthase n=1 Tax=Lygus hesperus TaxID=30085 RepID=A0A0A9Y537_LYGHE